MLPEFGTLTLIAALLFSAGLATVPLAGYYQSHAGLMRMARPLGIGTAFFLTLAFVLLSISFLQDDFTVRYIANNSNSALPFYYKLSGVWGGHEGSMLLWVMILGFWVVAVAARSRTLPLDITAVVLAIMGLVLVGFIAFTLFTSNPFDRVLPFPPVDGRDLNPLLQDPGLVMHPPILYMGYVGFAVAFAFACAALLLGRLDSAWARWTRPWTNVAWVFMTLGIGLGSWWAYAELGWGGWWFWDPVENASLIPWLLGTALIHSLAATDKRGVYKGWTVLLAIATFSMTLLGTFLVRSGVLTSVHSFANDPARGAFILGLFALYTMGALILYAVRLPRLQSAVRFEWLSRDMFLLGNNLVLTILTVIIVLLTFAPVMNDLLGLRAISIGAPWFNDITVLLAPILVLLLGVGQWVRWKRHEAAPILRWAAWAALAALSLALLCSWLYAGEVQWRVVLGLFLAWWLIMSTLKTLADSTRNARPRWRGLGKLSRAYYGMLAGHLGLAVLIVGVTMATQFERQIDVRMAPGDEASLGDWTYRFDEFFLRRGPNFESETGRFLVSRGERLVGAVNAEKRFYPVAGQVMTQAGILERLNGDLYVTMGEVLNAERNEWAVRLQVKPFVRWIWLGGLIMAAGGLLAITDRRYRQSKRGIA